MFEAKRALNEDIIASKEEADLAMIYGTGFPPFRGGLVYQMDMKTPEEIQQSAAEMSEVLADNITYTVPNMHA